MSKQSVEETSLKELAARYVDAREALNKACSDRHNADDAERKAQTLLENIANELRKHVGPNVPQLFVFAGDALVNVRESHVTVEKVVK